MKKELFLLSIVILLAMLLMGCAGTMQAIENRNLTLSAKMSDTIFLDPGNLSKNNKIYVRVTNTSDFQEIDFGEALKSKLSSMGYSVVSNPDEAGYTIQANLLYLGEEKKGLTADGMLAGGYGGAIAGAALGGRGWKGPLAGATAGAMIGSVVGGVMGSLIHIDTYMGAVDIQIKEPIGKQIKAVTETVAQQGSSTNVTTKSEELTDKQEYRTRIVVTARQTNINRAEACTAIIDKLATQIASLFRK